MSEQKHRNFDEEYPVEEMEQISFTLAGHTFRTRTYLHPLVYLEQRRGLTGAVDVLRAVLLPEDVKVLNTMLEDPNAQLTSERLDQAAAWCFRYLSGVEERPTTSPATSGSGGETTGPSSEESSSSLEAVSS